MRRACSADRPRAALVAILTLLLLAGAGCGKQSAGQAAANKIQPATQQAPKAAPVAPKPKSSEIDPIDADAELVLASMKPEWRAMLAKAEEFNRKEHLGWCMTCHIDIQDELKGGKHEKEEISCVECHGPSERHARNENNEVKPDQVFARKAVDRACGECHDCQRPSMAEPAGVAHQVCTDCHKAHKFLSPARLTASASAVKTGR
jgi:hypothetical protein